MSIKDGLEKRAKIIFKHKLVPNAEILSKDESSKIIEKYRARKDI
jgi:DNA-directed RNA polymerase subunit H (RpoH/RPB5)